MIHHRCDIFRVADQCGIRLLKPNRHNAANRRPRECFAKKTLKQIGRRHGEAHLALVLRLIVETRGNAAELHNETIRAISALLSANPDLINRGGALFDEFDRISLGELRDQAKTMAIGMPVTHVMRVILALRLYASPHRLQEGQAA